MKRKALLLLSLGLLFLIQARGICWSQKTVRVSVDSAGVEGDGPSFRPSISADGRYVAFESAAKLVATDSGLYDDIFVHDRDADGDGIYDDEDGTYDPGEVSTVRVSVDDLGNEGSGNSHFPSISADGMHVAFESDANNLVGLGNDTNPFSDIFVHDLGGTTTLVSVDSTGAQDPIPSSSSSPSLSSDGRYVAFDSDAELVATDSNGLSDIFVHDRDADENGTYDDPPPGGISTVRVSVDSGGGQADEASVDPSISADGRYVAFSSFATVLVGSDDNEKFDIFVHDRDADGNGTYDEVGGVLTVRVSVDSGGGQALGDSNSPSISDDGRYVAFDSDAENLVGMKDTNGRSDIFVHDRDADGNGTYDEVGGILTVRVSVDSGGGQALGDSNSPSISDDGRYVAFDSDAENLVGMKDTNGRSDIFVHDRDADGNGTYDEVGGILTVRVSVASGGGQANGDSLFPSISGDGRYVAFYSEADNLVVNDLNGSADIFVHDRDADEDGIYDESDGISTVRVSVASGGGEANGDSSAPSISSDGKFVAFSSFASNLLGKDNQGEDNDKNDNFDIFVNERQSLPTVDSTSPTNNANGVAVGSSITATFSEPMNGSTIDSNTFTLDNGVTGTVSYDANSTTATFTPSSKLDYDTTYTATITTAVRDLADNPMLADYIWSFTTQSERNNSGGSGLCFIATAASD